MGSETVEPRRTPEPEGPEQISERMRRTREGPFGKLKRALSRVLGLDDVSPTRSRVIVLVALAESGLLGLGFLTDLPSSWLITAALAILPFVFHQEKEDGESETNLDENSGRETREHSHDDSLGVG